MRLKEKERGVALLLVIVTILVLSIIAGAVLVLVNSRYRVTAHLRHRTKAFYLAEAGIQHALWRIRNNADGGHGEPNLRNLQAGHARKEDITIDTSNVDIEYTKTVEGPDSQSSKDDKFTIKATVTY